MAAFSQQYAGFEISVFRWISSYQYGKSACDVFRGIWWFIYTVARFLKPVSIKGAQNFLKSSSEAIKDSATINDVI